MVESIVSKALQDPESVRGIGQGDGLRLIEEAERFTSAEPPLIRLPSDKTLFIGDIHGDFNSMKAVWKMAGSKRYDKVVFLGDIVDRGSRQIHCINLALCLSLGYPGRVILLRGNHECSDVNSRYGFYSECTRRYPGAMYRRYNRFFGTLSYAVLTGSGVLGVHAGIPSELRKLEDLNSVEKTEDVKVPAVLELLWNDPAEDVKGFSPNWLRGSGRIKVYGPDAFEQFLKENGLSLVVRGHQAFPEGYRFFFGNKLLSIFSCKEGYYPRVRRAAAAGITDVTPDVIPLP